MTRRAKNVWRFEAFDKGDTDPFLTTTFTGFETSARRQLMEFHRQLKRIYPTRVLVTRMQSIGTRPILSLGARS